MLIFDANNLAHIAKHSVRDEYDADSMGNSIVFFFLNRVLAALKEYHQPCVFCWDSGQSYRRMLFADYKGQRVEAPNRTDQEILLAEVSDSIFPIIRKRVLHRIGFRNVFMHTGFEADDLIASIVRNHKANFANIVVSADHDLFQLLDDCTIWDPRFRQERTREWLLHVHGVTPLEFLKARTMSGDASDNIPGVKGVGLKTAIKHVKGLVPAHHRAAQRFDPDIYGKLFQQNCQLMTLPYPDTPRLTLRADELSLDGFLETCEMYNLYHFVKPEILEEWKHYLDFQ